jgi:hypothetical protein
VFLVAVLVLAPALSALAQGRDEEPSLFDAWWARVFCLYLLIPVAAFIRRLFAGWLNFLGIDEEKWAGLGAGMLGGLVGLGMATAIAVTAGGRSAGWLLGHFVGGRAPDWFRQGPPGGPGGGGTAPGSPGPVAGGEGAIPGSSGPAAEAGGPESEDRGGNVLPAAGVKGEGAPETGSRYEVDPERARRQVVQDWLQQARLYRESVSERRKWLGELAPPLVADLGRAAGITFGVMAVAGLGGAGTSWGRDLVQAFGEMGAAPGRLVEAALRAPPPRYPQSLLDGARWR